MSQFIITDYNHESENDEDEEAPPQQVVKESDSPPPPSDTAASGTSNDSAKSTVGHKFQVAKSQTNLNIAISAISF